MKISEKSKKAFTKAAKKLGLSTELPDLSILRPDLALYLTAKYMLVVIIEAGKDGNLFDITNHSECKYEALHYAKEGYKPGSSGGGFSSYVFAYVDDYSSVGARLSFNSSGECRENAQEYADLWEIVTLNVK